MSDFLPPQYAFLTIGVTRIEPGHAARMTKYQKLLDAQRIVAGRMIIDPTVILQRAATSMGGSLPGGSM
jgi:hypothetical protein